jgi:DNA (cytosine-5)-methyltransferase 1
MTTLRVGAMFAGYGGIELALGAVLGAHPAWVAETDPAASTVLARHWPTAPNLGDVTAVDWSTVDPVDVITGGSPCQDLSDAGKRMGMRPGTRSGLWASMLEAVRVLRPSLVVWENVRGALSAEADSELEPCAGCVGGVDDGPVLRALGRVLGDLAGVGYDAAWCGLRAADVGAPHGRFRIFVLAWPAVDTNRTTGGQWRFSAPGQAETRPSRADVGGPDRAPLIMLPTPTAMDSESSGGAVGSSNVTLTDATTRGAFRGIKFGIYAPAIARWEPIIGRPAPDPTEPTGKDGAHRLAPRFVEWMMGLPEGHVTDLTTWPGWKPSAARRAQLQALGNGVVPQQCAAAVRHLLTVRETYTTTRETTAP